MCNFTPPNASYLDSNDSWPTLESARQQLQPFAELKFCQVICTLYIVIDGTPISTFGFAVDLSENHLSYINMALHSFLIKKQSCKYFCFTKSNQ